MNTNRTGNCRNALRMATASLAMFAAIPFLGQTSGQVNPSNAQVQTGASTAGQSGQASTGSQNDQNYATGQPLSTTSHEGFWGHVNPLARKKWVHRQLDPVKDRLNELDGLSATNAKNIKDLDARSQAGIAKAEDAAQVADQHATAAENTANQAQQVAQQASNQTNQINSAVSTMDQYQAVSQVEIRFKAGQSVLGENAKSALDQLASQLANQHGYLIDVQGYSPSRGTQGIAASRRMAAAVTRYLVTQHQVPLYRIRQIGMGNAPMPTTDTNARRKGSVVEVSLMHNSLSTMSASNAGGSKTGATQSGTPQSSSNGTASQPINNQ